MLDWAAGSSVPPVRTAAASSATSWPVVSTRTDSGVSVALLSAFPDHSKP